MYAVRLATASDLAALPAIERAAAGLFPEEDLPADARADVTSRDEFERAQAAGRLWVAVHDQVGPVGFALLVPMEHHIHLEELDVHPDHGRRGLGARLVRTALEWAVEQGFPGVSLTTFRHLPWNAPFYERMGFRPLEEGELSPALRAELDWEAAQGLARSKRTAMWCRLPFRLENGTSRGSSV